MKLTVLTLGGESFILDVNDDMTLINFKTLLEVKSNVPSNHVKLVWQCWNLTEPERRLCDYGIRDGDTLLAHISKEYLEKSSASHYSPPGKCADTSYTDLVATSFTSMSGQSTEVMFEVRVDAEGESSSGDSLSDHNYAQESEEEVDVVTLAQLPRPLTPALPLLGSLLALVTELHNYAAPPKHVIRRSARRGRPRVAVPRPVGRPPLKKLQARDWRHTGQRPTGQSLLRARQSVIREPRVRRWSEGRRNKARSTKREATDRPTEKPRPSASTRVASSCLCCLGADCEFPYSPQSAGSEDSEDGEKRKSQHNILERNRRTHQKHLFRDLRLSLPNMGDSKTPKVAILKRAAEHIRSLQRGDLQKRNELVLLRRRHDLLNRKLKKLRRPDA